MKKHHNILLIVFLFTVIFPLSVMAGAPLKGVDVKLGRNPGGIIANRTADNQGKSDFGLLPAGSYYLEFAASGMHIEVTGSSQGKIVRDIAVDEPAGKTRRVPVRIEFSVNEKQHLGVRITSLDKPLNIRSSSPEVKGPP
jgi:hypothetical protein